MPFIVTVQNVQKRWKNLRAGYTRELRYQKADDGSGVRKRYIYFDKLWFLKSAVEVKEDFNSNDDLFFEHNPEELVSEESYLSDNDVGSKSKRQRLSDIDPLEKPYNSFVEEKKDNSFMSRNIDADEHFALSLLPMLRSIPLDKKINAQIDILKVLKEHVIKT